MLKELANEIIETLSESEAKDIRITELENENTELKEINASLNTQIAELQAQSNLKLEEVKSIVKELKELVANV